MALVQLKLDERIDGLIDICGNSLRSRTTAATILYTSEFYDYLGGNFRQLQGLAMVGEAALLWALMKQNHARGFSSADMDISRQAVIENDRIAQLCDTCGLTQLLFTTQSLAGKKVKVSAFRALIGAIGLESGSDAVDTVMHLLGVTTE